VLIAATVWEGLMMSCDLIVLIAMVLPILSFGVPMAGIRGIIVGRTW